MKAMLRMLVVMLVGICVTPAYVFAVGPYTIIDLGTLGDQTSEGRSVSNTGQVAGGSYVSHSVRHAFLYNGSSMIDLGTLGGSDSYAWGINSSGQVSGWSLLSGNAVTRAFIYSGGVMNDLGTLG